MDVDKKELLGIFVISNWYCCKKGIFLLDILGIIFIEKVGLLREEVKKYLKKGYLLNDWVGIFYFEK